MDDCEKAWRECPLEDDEKTLIAFRYGWDAAMKNKGGGA